MPVSSIAVHEEDLLVAIVHALVNANIGLTEMTCFLSLHGFPPKFPPADLFVMVSPSGGSFDEGLLDGGQAAENSQVFIKIISRVMLDEIGEDTARLTSTAVGALALKRQIIKTLTFAHPQVNGVDVVRDLILPTTCRIEQTIDETMAQIILGFAVNFDHDLLT